MSYLKPYPILFAGVAAASFASIFIRMCQAPPLVIAAWRLGLASLFLMPLALSKSRHEILHLNRQDFLTTLLSGIFLGLHFALWITSLTYTSVASSVVLVTTNPIFVGIASHLFLREKVTRATWEGIALSIVGSSLIGISDLSSQNNSFKGDILALLGAVMISCYLLSGRRLRQKLSLISYISVVYSTAAFLLILLCLGSGQRFTGYSNQTYLLFFALALVPQIIGHTSINWSLKYLPPAVVSVAVLGEPIGSTVLAYPILHEKPAPMVFLGGITLLIGIYRATRLGTDTLKRK